MSAADPDVERLFAASRAAHDARDTARAIDFAREALRINPDHVPTLDHLATLLITRRQRYSEGLGLIERAAALSFDDAGVWYALGWLCEFAAHAITRRSSPDDALDARTLYERATAAFRHCLSLNPEGKLQSDAEDLLDHVENRLKSMR